MREVSNQKTHTHTHTHTHRCLLDFFLGYAPDNTPHIPPPQQQQGTLQFAIF